MKQQVSAADPLMRLSLRELDERLARLRKMRRHPLSGSVSKARLDTLDYEIEAVSIALRIKTEQMAEQR